MCPRRTTRHSWGWRRERAHRGVHRRQWPDPRRGLRHILQERRHSNCIWEALSKRSGRHINPRNPGRRVPFIDAVDLAQRQQIRFTDQSGGGPGGIQHRRGVTFGQHKAIVVESLGVGEVVAQGGKKQRGHQLRRRDRRRRVSRSSAGGAEDRVTANATGEHMQRIERGRIRGHGRRSPCLGLRENAGDGTLSARPKSHD